MTTPAIYLVDDDSAILDSLSFLMESYGFTLTPFSNGEAFLEQVDLTQPGCVILDSRMPGLTGQDLQRQLVAANSPLAVIFLTGHGDVPMAVDAFKSGAFDFFQKPVKGQDLAASLRKGLEHSQARFDAQLQKARLDTLSDRERAVFKLVVQGHTNKQMADSLCVAVRTIEVHRANMMKKLNVDSLAALMQLAQLAD
ncbi:response regulator transcription factor [Ferrimonas balearica]|uniref:response regulator transcription factor n=1 Tax=Ferrimonas balearica TaxID=44012 RepID=UPI001C98FA42|nr:response regulator [Ferrimonas balearica]MBY5922663.1 response regulator [Ferrimonas balearica]MBY5995647.1 response regulator [Ferrimonas balearica]